MPVCDNDLDREDACMLDSHAEAYATSGRYMGAKWNEV